jgi:molybdopterin biosynthesis enzyme MoaB
VSEGGLFDGFPSGGVTTDAVHSVFEKDIDGFGFHSDYLFYGHLLGDFHFLPKDF